MRKLPQAELASWARHALLSPEGARRLSVHAHAGSVERPEAEEKPPGAKAIGDEPAAWKAAFEVRRKGDRRMPSAEPLGARPIR